MNGAQPAARASTRLERRRQRDRREVDARLAVGQLAARCPPRRSNCSATVVGERRPRARPAGRGWPRSAIATCRCSQISMSAQVSCGSPPSMTPVRLGEDRAQPLCRSCSTSEKRSCDAVGRASAARSRAGSASRAVARATARAASRPPGPVPARSSTARSASTCCSSWAATKPTSCAVDLRRLDADRGHHVAREEASTSPAKPDSVVQLGVVPGPQPQERRHRDDRDVDARRARRWPRSSSTIRRHAG